MQFTALFFAYAAIVILAVGMACFAAPEDRVPAIISSSVLVLVWMACEASFTPYSIEQFVTGKHDLATHLSAWAVFDTLAAVTIGLVGFGRVWASLLFVFLVSGVVNICVMWSRANAPDPGLTIWQCFNSIQDVIFLGEEAIFFALGANGCAAMVSRALSRIGLPALHKGSVRSSVSVSE